MSGRHRRPLMSPVFNRRQFLRRASWSAVALTGSGVITGCSSSDQPAGGRLGGDAADMPVFRHGVASGDPLSDRAVLWTRVTPPANTSSVTGICRIALDPDMTMLVNTVNFATDAGRDFTVKLDPSGMTANTTYFYQFEALGQKSMVGRTKTLPVGPVDRLRFGIASCSSLGHGFFNAYRFLSQRADLDVVIHLGDYIYEYGTGEFGDARAYDPEVEILTLEDYRTRYGQYRLDPDLQLVHQQHPMINIWDDHESADNTWRDNAKNHTESDGLPGDDRSGGNEGCWDVRKAWAIQAYREWLPIRDNLPDYRAPSACGDLIDAARREAQERIYRRFDFGDLVSLTMLDTRLIGRDQQRRPNISDLGAPGNTPDTESRNTDNDQNDLGLFDACAAPFDGDYSMLGQPQKEWLFEQLENATARWRFIGQQLMMGQLKVVGTPEAACAVPGSSEVLALLPAGSLPGIGPSLETIRNNLPALSAGRSIYLNADQWDGYPVERAELLNHLSSRNMDNVVVLTGDIHTSWAIDLTTDPNNPAAYNPLTSEGAAAVEFVCTSVTSPGLDALNEASDLFRVSNPHMKYIDLARKGYMVLDITPERVQGEWWYISTIAERGGSEAFGRAFFSTHGSPGMQEADGPTEPRPNPPPLAPTPEALLLA